MFTFMKNKDKGEKEKEEKEKRKREKRERKEKLRQMDTSKLSPEELQRLEEVKRHIRRTAAAEGTSTVPGTSDNLENDSSASNSTWSLASTGSIKRPTTLPPRPPSRGILKGQNYNAEAAAAVADDEDVLLKNTKANEFLYENLSPRSPTKRDYISPGESADREVVYDLVPATTRVRAHKDHVSPVSPKKLSLVPPPKPMTKSELMDLTSGEAIGINQRPLSSEFDIKFPSAADGDGGGGPLVREISVQIPENGDFGFRLSRHSPGKAGEAKSGSGRGEILLLDPTTSGLRGSEEFCPGDQVLEVEGIAVLGKSKEEVMNIIREKKGQELKLKARTQFSHFFNI